MRRNICLIAFCLVIELTACGGSGGTGGSGGGGSVAAPAITSISPTSATAGSQSVALTVTGSGFNTSSTVEWNSTALTTTYSSATSLSATIPASALSSAGTNTIVVSNPSSSGGNSNSVSFAINNPQPALTSISPNSATAGGAALTITATGSNFMQNSTIDWNGTALTTTYVSATSLTAQISASDLASSGIATITVVTPTPGGGTSASLSFSINAPGTSIRTINIEAQQIAWDSTHAQLYATVSSSSAASPNSVVAIDPVSGNITATQTPGNNPDPLAIAADASLLYAGLDGNGTVVRYSLPSLTPDPSFNLQVPASTIFGPQLALSLAVSPSSAHTFATILGSLNTVGSNTGGTWVYDDATPRTQNITYYNGGDNQLVWGATNSTLYGNDNMSSGFDLYVMSVDNSGLTLTNDYGYLVPSSLGKLHFDAKSGYLYVDGGRVVDPAKGNLVGTFNLDNFQLSYGAFITPSCAPDTANNVVYCIGQTAEQYSAASGVTIDAFDATTYRLLATLPIPQATGGQPYGLLRWGNAGLAFITASSGTTPNQPAGTIYLVDGAFVSSTATPDFTTSSQLYPQPNLTSVSPQSAAAGSSSVTLTVNGANFASDAAVQWNGTSLPTTYVSATQLQATIAPSSLASPGTAVVSVINTSESNTSANSLAFTITPASSSTSITAINLASLDLAWDATNAHLIAPVWSADPQYGNTLAAIDPSTGAIVTSVATTPDPDLARISSDGNSVFTGYAAANWATQLALPGFSSPSSFNLGADSSYGPYFALDLQAAPGSPDTAAITLGSKGVLPPAIGGIVIYDSGVPRPTKAPGFGLGNEYDNLQWGSDSSSMYATDLSDGGDFYAFTVNTSGVSLTLTANFALGTSGAGKMHFDSSSGNIYDDNGMVINPANGTQIGTFNASGLMAVDSTQNRVYILGQTSSQTGTSNYTIQSFNKTSYAAVSSIPLFGISGTPVAFIRWGTNGLAFVTYNSSASTTGGPAGVLYILNDATFVSSASHAANGQPQEKVKAFPIPTPFPARASAQSK
jgi:hypothetical protein